MEQNQCKPLTIGMTAPDFTEDSTFGPIRMCDYKGKWVIFFSHPGDFTPVCTTEFIAFTEQYHEFQSLGCELLGLSIDSTTSHLAWVNTIHQMTGRKIPFPIIADRTGKVASLYQMIAANISDHETVRNVYFIDPEQKIRAIFVYPLTNGRYIPEILRLLKALQTSDRYNVATPANWVPGQKVVVPAAKTYAQLEERKTDQKSLGLDCKDWFLCYKEIDNQKANQTTPQKTNVYYRNNRPH